MRLTNGIVYLFSTTLIVLFSSCSNSRDNPTAPEQTVAVSGNLATHGDLQGTILRSDLLFDGSVIASAIFSRPSPSAKLAGTTTFSYAPVHPALISGDARVRNFGDTRYGNNYASLTNGVHTIAFRITNQSSSPNAYDVVNAIVTIGTSTFYLADTTVTLSTGQSVSYSVNF